jgi:hypothetical protein
MMPDHDTKEKPPILVDFTVGPGLKQVALSPAELARKSAEAIDSAMNTIHVMASRVISSVNDIVERPSQFEVTFGIKFDAQTGAIIAKAGMEASINVKLTWQEKSGG